MTTSMFVGHFGHGVHWTTICQPVLVGLLVSVYSSLTQPIKTLMSVKIKSEHVLVISHFAVACSRCFRAFPEYDEKGICISKVKRLYMALGVRSLCHLLNFACLFFIFILEATCFILYSDGNQSMSTSSDRTVNLAIMMVTCAKLQHLLASLFEHTFVFQA
ncbi:hypothetical protein O6H91_20G026800 [Diphasiastrum complanatum]|uniref:Uncharacterized protein n=1 Tax=Diphasiastrum complanatum TaxID=34168 RepID=A0ACC2ANR5_DIPCM|nr:hypothetical protein O6H91_20G026800 [Diphasiastrum complanatum]